MLGNCEKMLLISSPPNEWPQQNINHIDDPKPSLNNIINNHTMASLATTTPQNVVGERISMDQKVQLQQDHQQKMHQQQQLQPPTETLRCPRCESTNTKFCYYNNYSLSQPRHFCKACKRYWTKGGTLRNVPVGGGCRKNKRVKRPSNNNNNNNSSSSSNTNTTATTLEGSVNSATSASIHDLLSSASNHNLHHSPLFYGSPPSDFNFPFSRYDLQNSPLVNGLGLGFSSGLVHNMNTMNIHNNNNNQKIVQDLISSNPLLSNYAATTTTTAAAPTTTTTTPPTISSILASSLMKGGGGNNNNFQTLLPSYEADLYMKGSGHSGMHVKEVKMEFQGQNRSFDNSHWDTTNSTTSTTQNQMDHHHHQPMGSSSDPSILWGSSTGANLGAWLDPSNNLGSSVPSLI